jgi:hypothetical protein
MLVDGDLGRQDCGGIEIDVPVPGEWECDVKASSEGGVTCHVEHRASGLGIMVLVESAEPVDVEEIVLRRTARPVDRHAAGNASGRNAFESIHGPGRRDTSRPSAMRRVPVPVASTKSPDTPYDRAKKGILPRVLMSRARASATSDRKSRPA